MIFNRRGCFGIELGGFGRVMIVGVILGVVFVVVVVVGSTETKPPFRVVHPIFRRTAVRPREELHSSFFYLTGQFSSILVRESYSQFEEGRAIRDLM